MFQCDACTYFFIPVISKVTRAFIRADVICIIVLIARNAIRPKSSVMIHDIIDFRCWATGTTILCVERIEIHSWLWAYIEINVEYENTRTDSVVKLPLVVLICVGIEVIATIVNRSIRVVDNPDSSLSFKFQAISKYH